MIGLFVIICGVLNVLWGLEVLSNENKQSNIQRVAVVSVGIVYLICGVFILCGVLAKYIIFIRIPSLIILVNWIINVVMALIIFTTYRHFFTLLSGVLVFGLICYFVIVLWNNFILNDEPEYVERIESYVEEGTLAKTENKELAEPERKPAIVKEVRKKDSRKTVHWSDQGPSDNFETTQDPNPDDLPATGSKNRFWWS